MPAFQNHQGYELHLRSLHQGLTYAGLLEGLPSKWMNDGIVERAVERAPKITYLNHVYLVEPKLTPIEHDREWPFGKPESLPMVTCIAEFKAFEMTGHKSGGHSELVVVWFQDEFALPFAEDFVEQLKNLDWEKHAGNISFDDY